MIHRLKLPSRMGKSASCGTETGASQRPRDSRAGFSLIELLTVIAIIAILAAVIFPVATTVRVRANQNAAMANLRSLGAAVGMHKLDERNFPYSLGPVSWQEQGGTRTYNGLYPEWMKDKEGYNSPANPAQDAALPQGMDTLVQVEMDASIAHWGGNFSKIQPAHRNNDPLSRLGVMMNAWNNMDGKVVGLEGSSPKYIMHYSRFRTFEPNDPDYKRQLGFRNPPDDTVVTWNDSFVRRDDQGRPVSGDYLVLFLSNSVKKYSVKQVAAKLQDHGFPNTEAIWRIKP